MDLFSIFILYLFGMAIITLIYAISENWKFNKFDKFDYYIFVYPIIPFIYLFQFLNKYNNYLNSNNLKQMNLKILGKAMGFMFLPTLGVLLMLLVGFFDPIMLWNWIKSDSGWAVFTRIIIFILEVGLVTILYFDYLKKEIKENAKSIKGSEEEMCYNTDLYALWGDRKDNDHFKFYKTKTEDSNIIIIERKSKKNN